MRKFYKYPFYLIINEDDQPLYTESRARQLWLFYRKQDAFDFMKEHGKGQRLFYKKRFVVKVDLLLREVVREYITSIL